MVHTPLAGLRGVGGRAQLHSASEAGAQLAEEQPCTNSSALKLLLAAPGTVLEPRSSEGTGGDIRGRAAGNNP